MRIFGLEITRARVAKLLTTVSTAGGNWFSIIREPWGVAWQSNITVDAPKSLLAFSAVFSCVTIIANDIAKLPPQLMKMVAGGVSEAVELVGSAFEVLRRPNHYQNWKQFVEHWIISKLLYGNTYVLKVRERGRVVQLYVLDPQRVTVLVAEGGDVYYRLARDDLSGLTDAVVVPASEVIHDLMNPLWHPLVGVSPIYACGVSATMGNRIQANSTKFFNNMSRPSGVLTSPGHITDETATRMKKDWEENFAGDKIGRLAVLGDGLNYEAMTIPANEAQLIEQLKWTVEDVARCFHVPLYKLGGAVASGTSVEALNQAYYSDCLQTLIESLELVLDEGLAVPKGHGVELDLDNLLRMDTAARYEAYDKAIKSFMKPNEARRKENLPPVVGGDAVYLQQQNYSLEALAKRDAREDPFATAAPQRRAEDAVPARSEDDDDEEVFQELTQAFVRGLAEEAHARG